MAAEARSLMVDDPKSREKTARAEQRASEKSKRNQGKDKSVRREEVSEVGYIAVRDNFH